MKLILSIAIVLAALPSCRRSPHPPAFTFVLTAAPIPPNELEFENHSSYSALITAGGQRATLPPRAKHRFKGLPDFIQVEFHQISGAHHMLTNSQGFETIPNGQSYLIR